MLFAQLKAELQNEMGLAADSSASGANVPGKSNQQHVLLATYADVVDMSTLIFNCGVWQCGLLNAAIMSELTQHQGARQGQALWVVSECSAETCPVF